MKEYRVPLRASGQRADLFVAQKYPQFSRSALSGLFEAEMVISGKKPLKPGRRLKPRQRIRVDETSLYLQPPSIDLPVLYEDDDVVVINKPAGLLAHSKGALNDEATVASFIKPKLRDKKLSGTRAGIVHRLDRATSGVIITAKTEAAQKFLQKQFASRRTEKRYLAVVEGWPEPEAAIIDAPISRNSKRPQTFHVAEGGKPSQTQYKTLKKLENNGIRFAYLELKPHTGRTHQIRVHLKYISHSVVGDRVYGKEGTLLLHAHKLSLTLPSGEKKIFTAPIPPTFKVFLENQTDV